MKLITSIKTHHMLYLMGFFFTGLYLYGVIDYAFYSYNRWGVIDLNFNEPLRYLHVSIGPFILAYHIRQKCDENFDENKYKSFFKKTIKLARFAYLIYLALIPLALSVETFEFLFYDFFYSDDKLIDLESSLIFLFALLAIASSCVIFKLTIKYR
jgi:hypothetical protein